MDQYERWETLSNVRIEFSEYVKFNDFAKVESKCNRRRDLHALLLLDELFPSDHDIVINATHEQIFLDVDDDKIETLSDEQIVELSRCGVFYDECGYLSMWVSGV